MSTRSAIGYKLPSGRIKAVYCHWDGYPKHHLPILIEHYNTLDKAKALIKPGSISSLRTEEVWCPDAKRDPQPLYYHERGDGDPPQVSASLKAAHKWWDKWCCEHMYIFEPDIGWLHYDLRKPLPTETLQFKRLNELLSSAL